MWSEVPRTLYLVQLLNLFSLNLYTEKKTKISILHILNNKYSSQIPKDFIKYNFG